MATTHDNTDNKNTCEGFVANRFKANKCMNCSRGAHLHEGLSNEDQVRAALAENDRAPCKIEDGLWMGSLQGAMNTEGLKSSGITHIVNCAKTLGDFMPRFQKYADRNEREFDCLVLNMDDHKQCTIVDFVKEANAFIANAVADGGQVFVHCARGVSRSGAIVVGYLMAEHDLTLEDALTLARSGRIVANPNDSFKNQLRSMRSSGLLEFPQVADESGVSSPDAGAASGAASTTAQDGDSH